MVAAYGPRAIARTRALLPRRGRRPRYAAWLMLVVLAGTASAVLAHSAHPNRGLTVAGEPEQFRLDSDADGSPLFRATNLAPGWVGSNCIRIRYAGASPDASLGLYARISGPDLAPHLRLTVELGTGGSFGNCAGFAATATAYQGTLSGFARSHGDAASALPVSALDGSGEISFRFVSELPANGVAMSSAAADFLWVAGQDHMPAPTASPTTATPDPTRSAARESPPGTHSARAPTPGRPVAVEPDSPAAADRDRPAGVARWLLDNVLVPAATAGSVSLVGLAVVLLFLLVQGRIDRRDPKLAEAPVNRPADLEFVDRSEIEP